MWTRCAIWMMLAMAGLGYGVPRAVAATPTEARAAQAAMQGASAYTLPPEKMAEAVGFDRVVRRFTVGTDLWLPLSLAGLLVLGWVGKMRDLSVRLFESWWLQSYTFVFLLLLAVGVLQMPWWIYGHSVSLGYGISVERWGSWLGDKAKLFVLMWAVAGCGATLVRWLMSRSPLRWWLWLWLPSVGTVLGVALITPYVIDPLFNKFEPLAASNPALVARLEQVVAHTGMAIPPERMFLMRASAKSTTLNAYVTGFGPSKRVVVWDTTVAKSSPDEIAFIFAHEMGHYVLGHVAMGIALSCLGLLPWFWLGDRGVRVLLRRYGTAWKIPSMQDLGALAVLALVLLVVADVTEPAGNAISRWMEHNADVYGQEAVHGIVADPQTVGVRSFQVLGEESLDDPTPHPLFEWWFDTHPTTRFRAGFARAYDPWAAGERPKFFAP
jgi:STE24 endopeptidase